MAVRIHFHPLVAPPADLEPFPAQTLAELLAAEGVAGDGTVNCILTGDGELAGLNERFRQKPGPTDVLAFPYHPLPGTDDILGDIYVSIDRAAAQADERGEPVAREVWRLFVHGALHLAGHDHATEATDRAMRRVQEHWVARLSQEPG